MASAANWKRNSYIQSGGAGNGVPGGSMTDGQFVAGNFIGLFAGPPRLATVGGAVTAGVAVANPARAAQLVYPIGITQNFNLSQNMQLARIFELGSDRSYFIPGRVVGQIGLGRVLYHGPSLLRVLYAYYQDLVPSTIVEALFPNVGASTMPNPHDVVVPAGYENFYINLASDLFSQPFGLLAVMRDSNQDTYGAVYAEACYIPNHSFSVDSQGVVIQEQVGIQYELLVPIATRQLKLIR
jgi:hypothetical protein